MANNYINLPPSGGAPTYASAVDLPSSGNAQGDLAVTIDTNTLYCWNGSAWVAIATPGAAIAIDGLINDVLATGPGVVSATVAYVGGLSAASVSAGASLANAATDANTALAIVKRDAAGKIIVTTVASTNVNTTNANVSSLTASQAVVTDGSKNLVSLAYTPASTNSTLVSRDIGGTSTFTNVAIGTTATVASGQTITMSYGSTGIQKVTGSGNVTFNLPDATYLYSGLSYTFNNNSSGTITINLHDGTTLFATVGAGGFVQVINTDNSTANGVWDIHRSLALGSISNTSGTTLPGVLTTTTTTQSAYNNSTSLASTAYVDNATTAYGLRTINAQSGTTYTFVISDGSGYHGTNPLVTFGSASATTVTVPTNASVPFPIGTQIECIQDGAGKVTFVAGSGVTINSQGANLSIAGQYVGVSLIKEATDVWYLIGNVIP